MKKFRKYRIEKHCLNCDEPIHGDYCHECGQANLDHAHNFIGVIYHYLADLIHFDNKIFSTIKKLLWSPGHLTTTYLKGARKKYIDPIKLYVFLSAVFFLFFAYEEKFSNLVLSKQDKQDIRMNEERLKISSKLFVLKKLVKEEPLFRQDSLVLQKINRLSFLYDSLGKFEEALNSFVEVSDSFKVVKKNGIRMNRGKLLSMGENQLTKEIEEKHFGDYSKLESIVFSKLKNIVPKVIFITIPIYALLLLLFGMNRKDNQYVPHIFYSMHVYCFSFLWIILILGLTDILSWWDNFLSEVIFNLVMMAGASYLVYYNFVALKRYMPSSWWKHTLRFIFLHTIMFSILLLVIIGLSYYILAH
ncbi:MAG: DUF3667 domain-containing protein [Chitinophagaceae bacterium]|nr:DUF3667 domain-containing protein [Chitinophagaceae bacterium]